MTLSEKKQAPARVELSPQQAGALLQILQGCTLTGAEMPVYVDLVNVLQGIQRQAGEDAKAKIEQAAIDRYLADQRTEEEGISEATQKAVDRAREKKAGEASKPPKN